ncbi:MAG: caspase family protein [Bacteroidia bacterium]|nr:caspase family protein [Bacteroidia bacterium]
MKSSLQPTPLSLRGTLLACRSNLLTDRSTSSLRGTRLRAEATSSLRSRVVWRSNSHFFLVILLILHSSFLKAQQAVEGKSPSYSFSITKEVKPPILNIVDGSVRFVEPGGNDIIDAGEMCRILFSLENTGYGVGNGLTLNVNANGDVQGISFPRSKSLDALKVGQKMDVEIPVSSNLNTLDGSVTFSFKVDEPNGFGSDSRSLEVMTLKFVSPMVEVVDYSVTGGKGGTLVKKFTFELQVLVQNTQYGQAEEVTVNLSLPLNVMPLSGNLATSIPVLPPGETKSIVYSLIVNDLYTGNQIPITLKVREKHGKFSKDRTLNLKLNQAVAAGKIVVDGAQTPLELPKIEIASLTTSVDKNIPTTGITHSNRYALIIGNEDYSSYQTGLSREVNVDFALNDARIFKKYVVNTLGVPERQVKILENATAAQIRQELSWISRLAELKSGNAELIFYYSGHGLPDENTREPYLIPVDVSGTNIKQGVKLSDVYKKLTEHPNKRVTVFLDACFSGGARNQGLLAMKSVKIKPNDAVVEGNMVVFASSSGEESSGVDRGKQHGFFTWFLLKKLQETKGEVTYKEMRDFLIRSVAHETTLISKPQTPQVLVSYEVETSWETWKFK